MERAVIVSALRTPIGRFMGGLSTIPAPKLAAGLIKEAHPPHAAWGIEMSRHLGSDGWSTIGHETPSAPTQRARGQHTSEMAREHGGMRAATEHHNEMHGTDLGVGEHAAHIREECGR